MQIEQTCGHSERREGMEWIETVALKHIHYHMWNRWLVGSCCIIQEGQPGALWQSRGVGWSREEGGGDICILMTDSLCCMAEANTTL